MNFSTKIFKIVHKASHLIQRIISKTTFSLLLDFRIPCLYPFSLYIPQIYHLLMYIIFLKSLTCIPSIRQVSLQLKKNKYGFPQWQNL